MARKPYNEKLRDFEARRQMVVALRDRGYKMDEIGQMVTPKISRQRVYQILKAEAEKA